MKDKLQIYLVTYNRKEKCKYTLDEILKSPVKDFDITVLDNASTDGTSELLDEYCEKYSNIKHIRHSHNIGGNANICRAFEMGASCGKDYFWVLCDDDKYNFENWGEVEKRIKAKDDIICVCDYICDTKEKKKDKAYQIFQLTFVPAGIYKSSLITDDVLVNMYDAILTMFQQAVVTIKCINENRKIHVLSKPIVFNGLHFKDKEDAKSLSFKRGGSEEWVMERREKTTWILGFANIITLLRDENLQKKCMEISIPYKDIYGNWDNFYNCMLLCYINDSCKNYFEEIYKVLPEDKKFYFRGIFNINMSRSNAFKNFIQLVFSLRNSQDKHHKVLTICGVKVKMERDKFNRIKERGISFLRLNRQNGGVNFLCRENNFINIVRRAVI